MPEPSQNSAPRLELRRIDKRFSGFYANRQIDLSLHPGEIHALLGENGAGKSTLVKIVYGVLRADAGSVFWEGKPVEINGPAAARRLGIGMVFQHFSLFESLSVTENVLLALDAPEPTEALSARIVQISERYGLPLDPRRHVHELSVGERQRVEIVRCLLQNPRLLIMDEPTSVLTPQESERLFATLRLLSTEGKTILYISHKLEEIRALCSQATVLRAGRVVAVCDPRQESVQSLARTMIGSAWQPARRSESGQDPLHEGDSRLAVENLSLAAAHPFGVELKAVSFMVRAGEIFGIAGVAGNGQAELMAALSGESPIPAHAAVRIDGRPVGRLDSRQRRDLGLAFVPEERLGRGAVPELSLTDNALLSGYGRRRLVRRGLIRRPRVNAYAESIIRAFDVRALGRKAEAQSLSGGNLQKFIIGREILQRPKLLICSQPTWGVDAGAAAAIHQALLDLRAQGAAIVIVSQDLGEVFTLADRIAVMSAGRLSSPRRPRDTSVEQIGLMMGGVFDIADSGEKSHASQPAASRP